MEDFFRTEQHTALLEAARSVREVVESTAEQAERDGTLTQEALGALTEAGLFRSFLPRELGGGEAEPLALIEVVEEVASQDGSTGWCLGMQGIISGIAAALLPEEGAREVFADPTRAICAGGFPPMGRARPIEGGYRVSGHFRFGSGCRHATWMVLTCVEVEGDQPRLDAGVPRMRSFCVPRQRVTILDNWQSAGLEGTASCDYTIDDEFVPDTHSFAMGSDAPRRGSPLFELPVLSVAAVPHAGLALGLGRQALLEIAEQARGVARLGSTSPLAERQVFQRDFARATTRLRGARGLVFSSYQRLWRAYIEGRESSLEDRADAGAATTQAYEVATEVATFAFRAAGARALFREGRLQRCFRDIQAGSQHIVPGDESWERFGQVYLGVGRPVMV
ncbi:acyl-CoA dehydrogenase family protein [Myxococcota bacterium]|nr:acyl-CoA dehydrogenase family protein [Myxococcota bacterium]